MGLKQKVGALLLFAILAISNTQTASAITPYLATGMLGQSSGGTPNYTTAYTNNIVTPNQSGLRSPYAIAIDSAAHLLFISDSTNHRVVVHTLDNTNALIDRTADFVLGQSDFSTRSATTTASGLSSPQGLSLDPSRKLLFVADSGNNRVVAFDYTSLSNGESAVNVIGQATFTTASPALTQSGLSSPQGVLFNTTDNTLFVSDTGNARVVTYDLSTVSDGETATHVLGDTNFTGGATGSAASTLYSPTGLVIDHSGNRLFVSDTGANRVVVYDSTAITDGEAAINVLGKSTLTDSSGGAPTSTASSLDDPVGLVFDSSTSRLYVADMRHSRVMIYDVSAITNGENAVNVLGQLDFVTYNSQADDVELSYPTGLAQSGNTMFVVSNLDHRVLTFDNTSITDGEAAVNIIGQTDANGDPRYTAFQADNIFPASSSFFAATGISIDTTGHRLFVSDWGNNRVLVHTLDSNNQLIDQTADAVLGQPNFLTDGDGLTPSSMLLPESLVYDSDRNWLFVADTYNSRVLVFDVSTITSGENAIYVLGQPDFTSVDVTPTQSSMDMPNSIVYDNTRKLLFVNDMSMNRILVYDTATISNGMSASYVLGQPDFTTAFGDGTLASQIKYPYVVEYDSATKWLFVADSFNDRLLVFDTNSMSNGMNASYVLGSSDINSAGTTAPTQSSLYRPEGLAIDQESRRLFVTDFNERMMIFDINSITNGENAIGILGRSNYTDSTAQTISQSSIEAWGDADFDTATNTLMLADASNNRLLQYTFVRILTTSLPSGTEGVSYSKALLHTASQGTVSFTVSSGSLPTGVTLSSSGVLSGTPTVSGTFNFSITASDDNGTVGTFSDGKSYSLTINSPAADSDGDGITDAAENSGVNGGDANGDTIPDASQAGVASTSNSLTGAHTTIASSSGTIAGLEVLSESELPAQNNAVNFPVGLNSFNVTGIANGASSTVTLYYDKIYDTSNWTLMKFNQINNTYANVQSFATYGTASIGGTPVTTVTYTLTDGGALDEDGAANGTIVDPIGVALAAVSAPNTGRSAESLSTTITLLFAACSLFVVSMVSCRMNTDQ